MNLSIIIKNQNSNLSKLIIDIHNRTSKPILETSSQDWIVKFKPSVLVKNNTIETSIYVNNQKHLLTNNCLIYVLDTPYSKGNDYYASEENCFNYAFFDLSKAIILNSISVIKKSCVLDQIALIHLISKKLLYFKSPGLKISKKNNTDKYFSWHTHKHSKKTFENFYYHIKSPENIILIIFLNKSFVSYDISNNYKPFIFKQSVFQDLKKIASYLDSLYFEMIVVKSNKKWIITYIHTTFHYIYFPLFKKPNDFALNKLFTKNLL